VAIEINISTFFLKSDAYIVISTSGMKYITNGDRAMQEQPLLAPKQDSKYALAT